MIAVETTFDYCRIGVRWDIGVTWRGSLGGVTGMIKDRQR